MVPLFWLGICVFVAWCIARRQTILNREMIALRTWGTAAAVVFLAVVGFLLYRDLRVVVIATARTVYPGARLIPPGSFPLNLLTSHLFQWTEVEGHLPKPLGNICEAAGFFWLAPVTLFLLARLKPLRLQLASLTALWIYFFIIFSELALPFPKYLARLLVLDRTGGTRVLPGLGLANIAIVAVFLSACCAGESQAVRAKVISWIGQVSGVCFASFCVLYLTNVSLGFYFSWSEIVIALSITTVVVVLLLQRKRWALALALVVPQALVFGGVNPIQRGLNEVTQSPLYTFVRAHRELLNGKWLVYSANGEVISGYMTMIGCDVYTGVKYLPDLDHFTLFVANGLPLEALNRDSLVTALPLPENTKPSVEVPGPNLLVWRISPTDPVLKGIGIKYFAFDERPSKAIAGSLVPLAKEPVSGLWLYRYK